MTPNPHVPGILVAPITATESGANKYFQWLFLLNVILPKFTKSLCKFYTKHYTRFSSVVTIIALCKGIVHGITVNSCYKAAVVSLSRKTHAKSFLYLAFLNQKSLEHNVSARISFILFYW